MPQLTGPLSEDSPTLTGQTELYFGAHELEPETDRFRHTYSEELTSFKVQIEPCNNKVGTNTKYKQQL